MSGKVVQGVKSVVNPARVKKVRFLYRRVIRELYNWSSSRYVWGSFIQDARAKFEENRNLTDEGDIQKAIAECEDWLVNHKHPLPYIIPEARGGSKFQRNTPPDLDFVRKNSWTDDSEAR